MKKIIICVISVVLFNSLLSAETNIMANIAQNRILYLTQRWCSSPRYPTYDEFSGIGQGIGVKYCGSSNQAPTRIYGIVVSRIITDLTKPPGQGEKWCLVEFGEGPPWSGYALTNLQSIAISIALKNFPSNGMETVKTMLQESRGTR